METIKLKYVHEEALRKLEKIESKAINSLSQTIAAKDKAISTLNKHSKSLRRTMQPRRAYRFRHSQHPQAEDEEYPMSEPEPEHHFE